MTRTRIKKTRAKKPEAEVVGSFDDLLRNGKCDDGRSTFSATVNDDEVFILAGTLHAAGLALIRHFGFGLQKIGSNSMTDRYREAALKAALAESDGANELVQAVEKQEA